MALKFTRITRPAIKSLERGQRLNEHGITVERLANGDVRYSVNVMVDGQRIHRVIGKESDGTTREQAERAIESFRTKAREGRLDLPKGRKHHRTFAEAASDYMTRLETTLSPGQKGYEDLPNKRRNLTGYLTPHFKDRRVDQISSFAIQGYRKKRVEAGAKLATINRELATLSHLFRQAVKWKWMREEDRPEITKDQEVRKQIVILTPAQADALYKAAVADQDPATHLFVLIGLNTAMRHSEILRLRWGDLDLDRRRIYIDRAKAGQRVQPITATLADALREESGQRSDDVWVFPATRSDAKTPYRHDMRKQFERAVTRAKLDPKKCTPHVMRHTGITRLVEARVDLPTIQRISGHKTLGMVMRYVHLSDDHIDRAIEAIDTGKSEPVTPELHTGDDAAEANAA